MNLKNENLLQISGTRELCKICIRHALSACGIMGNLCMRAADTVRVLFE